MRRSSVEGGVERCCSTGGRSLQATVSYDDNVATISKLGRFIDGVTGTPREQSSLCVVPGFRVEGMWTSVPSFR